MTQDQIFFDFEGDRWFRRNTLTTQEPADQFDWPCHLIGFLDLQAPIHVIELGCANGWRLERLRQHFKTGRFVGVDASYDAIEHGRATYPKVTLHHGVLQKIPLQEIFDLVIVNFVLHWVDRSTLGKTLAEIDRVTGDGGVLVLGDFLPDFPQRRHYHHLPQERVFTYKQEYATMFTALGTYKEIARITTSHDTLHQPTIQICQSAVRVGYSILHKSVQAFYPEVS